MVILMEQHDRKRRRNNKIYAQQTVSGSLIKEARFPMLLKLCKKNWKDTERKKMK